MTQWAALPSSPWPAGVMEFVATRLSFQAPQSFGVGVFVPQKATPENMTSSVEGS